MPIGIDIDDVLLDFTNPLLRFYESRTGKSIQYCEVTSPNLEDIWGGTKQEAVACVRDFYKSTEFGILKPLEGSVETVQQLYQRHKLVLITSRHNEAKSKTPIWLARHLPFLDSQVIYAGEYQEKAGERLTKADICLREGIDIIVEDNGQYALECAVSGVRAYLFNRPWNNGFCHPNITRVETWREVAKHIDSL